MTVTNRRKAVSSGTVDETLKPSRHLADDTAVAHGVRRWRRLLQAGLAATAVEPEAHSPTTGRACSSCRPADRGRRSRSSAVADCGTCATDLPAVADIIPPGAVLSD